MKTHPSPITPIVSPGVRRPSPHHGASRSRPRLACTTVLLAVVRLSPAADVVVRPGDPAQIVTRPAPTATERFAASELARYVKAMSGLDLPVKTDAAPLSGVTFAVGRTRHSAGLGDRFPKGVAGPGADSFVIKVGGDLVVLVGGGDRGTLYSVYEFLERQGCRWFMPGELGEIIPKRESIAAPEGEELHVPDFIQREIDGGASDPKRIEEIVDWAGKNRLNRIFGIRRYHLRALPKEKRDAWDKRGGYLNWQWICHNFSWMVPPRQLFEPHPEYFAFHKVERVPMGSGDRPCYGGGNLCTTNEEVIRLCADYAAAWFDRNPDGMIVPLNPNDGTVKWCECDRCRQLGGINFMPGEKGSMSRRMVTFANAVARRVRARHPDRFFMTLAYSNYVAPEPGIPLEENLLAQYCLHGCYAHPPGACGPNGKPTKQIETWAKLAPGRLAIWEYFLLGDFRAKGEAPVLLPLAYRARDSVRWFKGLGARWYFTQSSYRYWRHNPLLFYMLARLLWETDRDCEALEQDFFSQMYGPAGAPARQFFRLIEESTQRADWHPVVYSDVASPSPKVFTPEVLERGQALLEQAEGLVADEVSRRRLALLREAFDCTKSSVRTMGLSGLDPSAKWRIERGADAYLLNADGRELPESRFEEVIRNAVDAGRYSENFERIVFRARKRKCPVVFLENDRLKLALLPGIGGRIIRIIDKRTGWNFLKEPADVTSLDVIGKFYFNYGGYEEYMGKAFGAPGWEKEYAHKLQRNEAGSSIVLTLKTPDLTLERTISLDRGDGADVSISSILTNTGRHERRIKLRVHPMMDLGPGTGAFAVRLLDEGRALRRSTVAREFESLSVQPQGLWAVVNEQQNTGVANRFDPAEVSCYLFYSAKDAYFNMELMGVMRTLAPGESLTIRHAYRIMTDAAKELPALLSSPPNLPAARPARPETPEQVTQGGAPRVTGEVAFAQGKTGQCASFGEGSGLAVDSRWIKPNAGTFECWVRPAAAAGDVDWQPLLSLGGNDPEWFCVSLGRENVGLLFKNGRSPYRGPGQFYASLSAEVKDWRSSEWRHIACVWANLGKGKSLIQIYVDGRLRADRYDATIAARFECRTLRIGRAGVGGKALAGDLDELRISNSPKTPAEIRAAYEAGRAGRPLAAEPSTLLLLRFDGATAAESATTRALDAARVETLVKKVIDGL